VKGEAKGNYKRKDQADILEERNNGRERFNE
jgi:hypothetical protein